MTKNYPRTLNIGLIEEQRLELRVQVSYWDKDAEGLI